MSGKQQFFSCFPGSALSKYRVEVFFAALLLTVCFAFLPYCVTQSGRPAAVQTGECDPLQNKVAGMREEMPPPAYQTDPVRVITVCARDEGSDSGISPVLRKFRNAFFLLSLTGEQHSIRPSFPDREADSFYFRQLSDDASPVRAGPAC